MKKVIIVLLCGLYSLFCFSGCRYDVPEGYKKSHFTYEEAVEYAKSIDPNAMVSIEYKDTELSSHRYYREWETTIFGIECHVASAHRWVWDHTGEFCRHYYELDCDFEFYLIEKILTENPINYNYKIAEPDDHYHRYDQYGCGVNVYLVDLEKTELSDERLEELWEEAYSIYSIYCNYPVKKDLEFGLYAPIVYSDYIKIANIPYLGGFSDEEGKERFFEKYRNAWNLIDEYPDRPIIYE